MVFRKIYWVAEEILEGSSQVTGVYTSVSDLHDEFISSRVGESVRITLVKLDSSDGVLGMWASPDFSGLEDALKQYIATGEFQPEECERLVRTLRLATAG